MNGTEMTWWDEKWSRKWLEVANHDLLRITNPHWLQFDPPSCGQHLLFAFLYAVIMIPGIVGNCVVILLFFRSPSLRVPSNVINVNLALADLIMNLEAPILIKNSLDCGPKSFTVIGCKLYGLSGGLSGTVAIISISAMAIQRYISISRPFDCGRIINMRNCLIVVLFTWIYGFTFSFMPVIGFLNDYTPEGYLTACSFDYLGQDLMNKVFVLLIFSAAYVFPLLVIVTSYCLIILKVRNTQQRFLNALTGDSPDKLNSIHMSLKALKGHHQPQHPRRAGGTKPDTAASSKDPSPAHSSQSCPADIPVRPQSAASASSAYQQAMIDSKARTEMRLIRCAATLIFVWTVAWTPYATIALLGIFSDASLITPIRSMLPALFCKSASVIDPYIYSCSHPKYRSEIQSLLRKVRSGFRCGRARITRTVSISMSRRTSDPNTYSNHHSSRS